MQTSLIKSMSLGQTLVATSKGSLERYFSSFRRQIIGNEQAFDTPYGKKKIIYADWTATGRGYQPIEDCIQREILPFIGNTHTATTITGTLMSQAYEEAKKIVKNHVGANGDDILIFCGSGMTSAVNKLQRILGLRIPEQMMNYVKKDCEYMQVEEALRPVVFVTHMEHHSNHTSWLETFATVEIIQPDKNGNVDLNYFRGLLERYKHRKNKIAAITACSNVTGIQTPYHDIAKIIHAYGGLCFVDFACSAPYINIHMHPEEADARLDAIYFSPHKFLGGAGTPGVLIFTKSLYHNSIPDQPGGGTVVYSNPWKMHDYTTDIEQREDGGTPPFLGGIKAAMCIRLKEAMGVDNILMREKELLQLVFDRFSTMQHIEILAGCHKDRLGVISFIMHGAHYNLVVKILNDRFGIQARGGCSCAGTYGHALLQVNEERSYQIRNQIHNGNLLCKPGWIRISLHPTMTNTDACFIMDAIETTALHFEEWSNDYVYQPASNNYTYAGMEKQQFDPIKDWFAVS